MQFKLLYLLCSQINSIISRKKLLHNKTCTYYVVGVLFLGKNRILENNIQTTRKIRRIWSPLCNDFSTMYAHGYQANAQFNNVIFKQTIL